MARKHIIEPPKWVLTVLNQLYEVERKLTAHGDPSHALRNVEKLKDALKGEKLFYEDPMGQPFKETRTDLDASIAGVGVEDLVVVEVIKPIVRMGNNDFAHVVQKGIVIVQSKEKGEML